MSPQPTPLGQYQLIEKIAQGGMAEIYRGKALDAHGIEKPVVIKRILPHIAASPEFVNMLVDEAKIAVMLSHGNIAQVYDLGKVADDYFIVMEFVEGKTLSQVMKRLQIRGEQIPIAYALYLCSEVANGLNYMHNKTDENGNPLNIVHRDISPQNVILSYSGTVKIIDFGIAKAKTKISTTDSGVVKGKFAYMSPEHADGEKLDYRTDIFSLGIILFELLTGKRLFKGKNNRETVRNVKRARIAPPSELREAVDHRVNAVVLKALERDKTNRYDSALAFGQGLTRLLIEIFPDFSPQEMIPFLKRIFPEDEGGLLPGRSPASLLPAAKTVRERHRELEETKILKKKNIQSLLSIVELYSPAEEVDDLSDISKVDPSLKIVEKPSPKQKGVGVLIAGILLLGGILAGSRAITPLITRSWNTFSRGVRITISKTTMPLKTWWHETTQPAIEKPAAKKNPPQVPPVPPPPLMGGTLTIQSNPPGARIFLDDVETDKTTPAGLNEITAGVEHKIGLYLDRYRFSEETFTLEKDQPKTLVLPLEINYGDLSILSLPQGAAVYLNEKRVGTTPFHMKKLEPGLAFKIRLSSPGYEDWTGGVQIFGGKEEVISAGLTKKPL